MKTSTKRKLLDLPGGRTAARLMGRFYGPPPGRVDFGSLRSLHPISPAWGFDRGTPVDRIYIERFLLSNASDVRGHVLEIREDEYTRRFGGPAVTSSDVLSLSPNDGRPNIIGDLTDAPHIPSNTYDCIILTQTLQLIHDIRGALGTILRILRPGGVLLGTVPGISKIALQEAGDYWRMTSQAWSTLLGEVFSDGNRVVTSYGNVLAAIAFLEGIAAEELDESEIEFRDPAYEVLICFRAFKTGDRP